jgi:CheY-like chemotaxis protein
MSLPATSFTYSYKDPTLHVLIIEDNRDFAQILRDILEIQGCRTEVAFDTSSGLTVAKQTLPDLIFCDIHFPGETDGYDFAKALRSDSDISHIPLVAVSGYITEEDRERAISTGFDLVFPKPVKFADLRKALSIFSKGKS